MTVTKSSKEGLLGIDCRKLHYTFAEGDETVLQDVDLELEQGSRCLLVGANGGELGAILVQLCVIYIHAQHMSERTAADHLFSW